MKKLLIPVLGVGLLSFSMLSSAAVTLKTEQDRLSYAIGAMTGKALKASKIDINEAAFNAGLLDSQSSKNLQMSEDEIKQTLQAFQQKQLEKSVAERKKMSDDNLKKGQAFLAQNANKPGVKTISVKLPNGNPTNLQYKVIKSGDGTGVSPTGNDEVAVNYEGRTIDGTVFDSSYRRGKPVTLALSQVIQGWQSGVAAMKPGDTWELYIPAELAYGEKGAGSVIGPNETLIFKIELISVNKKVAQKK